jgi:hypothetical protein
MAGRVESRSRNDFVVFLRKVYSRPKFDTRVEVTVREHATFNSSAGASLSAERVKTRTALSLVPATKSLLGKTATLHTDTAVSRFLADMLLLLRRGRTRNGGQDDGLLGFAIVRCVLVD